MLTNDFTIRVVAPNPHRANTQTWKAGCIVSGMEGCRIESIVQALAEFEETRPVGRADPARWLTHFAGLESSGSGKKLKPWVEIIHCGHAINSTAVFRDVLRTRANTAG